MAEKFKNAKWKKKTLAVLSVSLAATLSLGLFSACSQETSSDDDEASKVAPTDTQIIKNGNFEFYSDKLVEPDDKGRPLGKKNIISSSIDNWTFTAGSPSSDTKSGVIDTADWDYFTKTGGFTFSTYEKGDGDDKEEVTTFRDIAEAYAHWEDINVSAYDRLKFLDLYKDEIAALNKNSDERKLFDEYSYSIDFEDVEKIDEEVKKEDGKFLLHEGATEGEGNEENTSVLMIHNQKTSDDVRGTAQYFTSSTTITLTPGTAAKVTAWVRTDSLYHYADTALSARGGAYIGVTNTVGGTTLDQMQIYNIHTDGEWQQYTVYVRASTFATTTFRIVLGLGQGSSDDKYYMVDGYAFFDDVQCELLPGEAYETAVYGENGEVKEDVRECTVDSLKEDKQFDYDENGDIRSYALDLYAPNDDSSLIGEMLSSPAIGLTEEVSGSQTYDSSKKGVGIDANDLTGVFTYNELSERANSNSYLRKVFDDDFAGERPFPFEKDGKIVMLLSAGGAAYTAKLGDVTLKADERLLVSFFIKTVKIPTGLSGAGAIVIDGENKTYINAFDSTTLTDVDIDSNSKDESLKDIYKGWAQCFFFLENTTEEDRTFHIELTYGPTSIVDTDKFSYGDGYAAFANFETKQLTKTEYGYATTGDRAKKVSLTGGVEESKHFDSVSATAEKDLETKPALPANYRGVLGGSKYVQSDGKDNVKPEGVEAGLLNAKYADNYLEQSAGWKTTLDKFASGSTGEEWWSSLFGNARQPLVIVNNEAAAWGYFAETATVSSYTRISMRVKASAGAKAYIYLTDADAEQTGKTLSTNLPGYTYWYDDKGNIVGSDPTADGYDEDNAQTGILYERQSNGLYLKKGGDKNTYYANLRNFEKDESENYVTSDGTIAYFYNPVSRKYYAYRTGEEGSYTYRTAVNDLPQSVPLRYSDYTDTAATAAKTEAKIVVEGNGEWQTVNFYVHAGNASKTYRLEVWSGSRDGSVQNPAGSYVAFDNYSSADASSNFSSLRDEVAKLVREDLNEGKKPGDKDFLTDEDDLPAEYALYYTFTFFDAPSYLRYDETQDEEELGDPYYSYKQSDRTALLVWLSYLNEDTDEHFYFLDFDATDVTVTRDYPPTEEPEEPAETDTTDSGMNIWLLISSGILAVVLVLVIVLLIVRALVKKFRKPAKVKAQKDNRYRPAKKQGGNETPDAEDESAEEDEKQE